MLDIVLLESSTHQAAVDSLVSPSFSDNSSFYTGHHPVFTSNRPSKLQNMTWTLDDVFPQRTHIITSLLSGQCRASSDPGVASARARAVRRPWRRSVRRRGDGQRFTTACVIVLPFFLGFVNFSTPPPPARSTEIEVDGAQYIPLKVASFAMGALKPFFQVQASVQAGRYDKWDVRKEIEEEIKSAPVVIYTYDWSPFSAEAKKVLDSMGADYREVSLGAEWFLASPQQAAKRAELGNLYGRTSMPHIFIGGRS
ncbi:unnamed protein product, partial [Durusdinium trenchii]